MAETKEAAPRKKIGRPLKQIDVELLKKLAECLCTREEMSHILGVSLDTLHERFSDVIKEAQSRGKCSLRRLQWKIANKGCAAMAIFLGKVLLNQREEEFRDLVKFNVNIRQVKYDDAPKLTTG